MIYSIAVYGSPYANPSSLAALRFSQAVIAAGHSIYRVFFYHESVHTGSLLATPAQDQTSLHEQWSTLATDYDIELIVCIAAALKRGVIDEQEADRWNKQGHNMGSPFILSGLGQLIDATMGADRHISFGV